MSGSLDSPSSSAPGGRGRARRAVAFAIVLGAVGSALAFGVAKRDDMGGERCGPGFVARGARCMGQGSGCPTPLLATEHGCDAPRLRVPVPAVALTVGPSDWEAAGRVAPRTIRVSAFRIDAFEVTRGAFLGDRRPRPEDPARAATAMTRSEAEAFCASVGGRLPTEDEWIAAASSAEPSPRRYPWGDTGAVCRRAAWGLRKGPCAAQASGPDTVGAHRAGDSPLGIHDLAGNAAEWVAPSSGEAPSPGGETPEGAEANERALVGVAKGGSWESSLASDLRIWSRLELPPGASDARVGFRCAYPP